jgi:hypothetical protein
VTYSSVCQHSIPRSAPPICSIAMYWEPPAASTKSCLPKADISDKEGAERRQRPLPHHHVSDGLPQRSIHHGMDHLDCRRPVRTRLADRP